MKAACSDELVSTCDSLNKNGPYHLINLSDCSTGRGRTSLGLGDKALLK